MIKIFAVLGEEQKTEEIMLLADTKAEVPETGTATAALIPGWKRGLAFGSFIVTCDHKKAWLNSNDEWVWEE